MTISTHSLNDAYISSIYYEQHKYHRVFTYNVRKKVQSLYTIYTPSEGFGTDKSVLFIYGGVLNSEMHVLIEECSTVYMYL